MICLPVRNLEQSIQFYGHVFGLMDLEMEEGIVTMELPNLSIFLMEQEFYESYSLRAGKSAFFPSGAVGVIISCALESREDVDHAVENAVHFGGGSVKASIDESFGGYMGYVTDPDGHLWELVFPPDNKYDILL